MKASAAKKFVEKVARMSTQGNAKDAPDALEGLIHEARVVSNITICDLCEGEVEDGQIIGTPSGKEICQDCFDAGAE